MIARELHAVVSECAKRELRRWPVDDARVDVVVADDEGAPVVTMTRIGPGYGRNARYDQESRLLRFDRVELEVGSYSGLIDAVRGTVRELAAALFPVHEGEGLP